MALALNARGVATRKTGARRPEIRAHKLRGAFNGYGGAVGRLSAGGLCVAACAVGGCGSGASRLPIAGCGELMRAFGTAAHARLRNSEAMFQRLE
jgi:hypothetical protein